MQRGGAACRDWNHRVGPNCVAFFPRRAFACAAAADGARRDSALRASADARPGPGGFDVAAEGCLVGAELPLIEQLGRERREIDEQRGGALRAHGAAVDQETQPGRQEDKRGGGPVEGGEVAVERFVQVAGERRSVGQDKVGEGGGRGAWRGSRWYANDPSSLPDCRSAR